MVFELTVVSSFDSDRKINLEMIFFKWDSFEAISTKTIKNLIMHGNEATVIYRDNIVNLLNSNGCTYGHLEECYVVFEVTEGDQKGTDNRSQYSIYMNLTNPKKVSTWHSPVKFEHLPAFTGTKTSIQIDNSSCHSDGQSLTFNLISDRAEPFVWLESQNGTFEDNLVLINQRETQFRLENVNNCDFLGEIRIFHPSMVSFAHHTLL